MFGLGLVLLAELTSAPHAVPDQLTSAPHAVPDQLTSAPHAVPDQLTSAPHAVPIIGGLPTTDPALDGVVAVHLPDAGTCTGIMVTPRLALTAAHCVAELDASDQISVSWGDDGYGPKIFATGWGYDADRFCTTCKHDAFDMGWVQLGEDVPATQTFFSPVVTQDEWDETMRVGTEVLIAGFGVTEPEAETSDGLKRSATMEITDLSPSGFEFHAGGDGLDSCRGDSGGPALTRLEDGTMRLLGVTSRGSEICGSGGIYAAPYPQLCTLRDRTGVDLLPPGCGDCDCLDTDGKDDGGCAIGDRRGSAWWSVLVLGYLVPRRRASRLTRPPRPLWRPV